MTDTETPIGERVAAVETDIKHVLDGIVRIEGSVARIENVVIKDAVSRLETDIARVDRRLTDTKAELRSDIARVEEGLRSDIAGVDGRIVATKEDFQQVNQTLLAAMSDNRKAFYVLCGTVIAGMVVALLKDGFL